MTTPALIIDMVCDVAKLDKTAASADRVLILAWLNQAVERVTAAAHVTVPVEASVTITSGTAVYQINASPFPTDMIAIHEMRITDGSATNEPLQQVTLRQINEYRAGSGQANATPWCYAVDYPQFIFYPTPGASTTLKVYYAGDQAALADGTTAITFIPKAMQWGCLYNIAMASALRYKNKDNWREYMEEYLADSQVGLPALKRWKAESGGATLPDQNLYGTRVTSPSQDTGF